MPQTGRFRRERRVLEHFFGIFVDAKSSMCLQSVFAWTQYVVQISGLLPTWQGCLMVARRLDMNPQGKASFKRMDEDHNSIGSCGWQQDPNLDTCEGCPVSVSTCRFGG